jgi:hypothetical protein
MLPLQSITYNFRVGGTEPVQYPVYSKKRSSTHSEHDGYFHLPDVGTDPLRSIISTDRQSIVMYLSLKGLNAVEIHNDLVTTLKGEGKPSSSVTYCLRKPSFSSPKAPQPSESPAPILNESEEAILLALSEELFASVRQLARRTHLHPSTV